MVTKNCKAELSNSELSLLVQVLRHELGARHRWLEVSSVGNSRVGRPAVPSLSMQQQQFEELARIYQRLCTLEKQYADEEPGEGS